MTTKAAIISTSDPLAAMLGHATRLAIVSCLRCGAALVVDPLDGEFDPVDVHLEWHESLRQAIRPEVPFADMDHYAAHVWRNL